jgi:hypothetical protein
MHMRLTALPVPVSLGHMRCAMNGTIGEEYLIGTHFNENSPVLRIHISQRPTVQTVQTVHDNCETGGFPPMASRAILL